jgi:hypothetical protein
MGLKNSSIPMPIILLILFLCVGSVIAIVYTKQLKTDTFYASSEEMDLWKPRIQDAVRCMLHLSFLGNTDATVYLYGDNILATNLFRTLFKEAGFASSANYFARTLWPQYRTFIESFPLSRKPLTLEEIHTFVQSLDIFQASAYSETYKACEPDLPAILDIYNSCKSFDVTRRLYGSKELDKSLEKRADYILCALKKSTEYESYSSALSYARFKNGVYTPNYFIYWNAKQWYNRFREESVIRTYLKNLLHIFYELEWVLSENKEAPDVSSLPETSSSCQELQQPKPQPQTQSSVIIQEESQPSPAIPKKQPEMIPISMDSPYVTILPDVPGTGPSQSIKILPYASQGLILAPLKKIELPTQKSPASKWKSFDTLDSSQTNKQMMIVAYICFGIAGILYLSAIGSVAMEKSNE